MMDMSSLIDSTIVWVGMAGMLLWAWATLETGSNTVSTNSLSEAAEPTDQMDISYKQAA